MTFLAYGNGAPDIFSALAAFSHSKDQSGVQLGIQALFGKMVGSFITVLESCDFFLIFISSTWQLNCDESSKTNREN